MLKLMFHKRLMWGLLFVCAIISIGIVNPKAGYAVTQASYYVSSTGSDSNNGTSTATPFATVTKARDVVRTINGNMTGDIYVYLMDGTHTVSRTLVLGVSDSGTNGFNVIYKAYTGATPIISGGVDITSGWTLHDAGLNIYKKTGINWNFRQLYVNDQRGVKARKPNLTDEITGAPYLTATNNAYPYTVNAAELDTWANLGTAEMVVVNHWSQYRGRIASYSGSTVTFKSPESGFAWNHHNQATTYYYFENALALLDTEGEWFLDSANTTLYYKPRAGETMNTTAIIAPKLETLVSILGTNTSTRVRNIQFNGITFKYNNWLAPNSYGYIDGQAGFRYQNTTGGNNSEIRNTARYTAMLAAVQLKYASYIKLDNNTFKYSGSWGVMGYEGTDHTSIVRNTFFKNAGGGVAMGIAGDQWDEQVVMDGQSTFDSITDNTVDSIGLDYAGMVGIGTMLPQNMTIARNEVKNLPYTGITLGWSWSDGEHGVTNNQVYQNNIHHVMSLLDDGGGVYTLGKMTGNSKVYNNYIHDIVDSPYSGGNPNAAIYFDGGSAYMTAENNVLNNTINAWYAYNGPNHDNTFQYNYYNALAGSWESMPIEGTTINKFQFNTSVNGGQSWPQGAVDVMNGAGTTSTPIPGNLALNKTVTAYYIDNSSALLQVGDTLANAVDGNINTKTQATDQWRWKLRVDLGAAYNLSRVVVKMPSAAYATAFDIQISTDGATFTTVKSVTGFTSGTSDHTIPTTTARYVSIVAVTPDGPNQTGGQMAISELEVYGEPSNLALNKAQTAYFMDNSTATMHAHASPSYAVDGDISTAAQATGQYRWKLNVDLGASYSLSRVVVKMPSTLYATAFNIQISTDGTTFTTVKAVTGFGGGTSDNTITTTTARYVSIIAVTPDGPNQTGGQMAISELEVYKLDLALNQPATAYYMDGSTAAMQVGSSPSYAVDGNSSTAAQATDQWRWQQQVDLGSIQSISKVVVKMPSTLYATVFDIKTSTDGVTFTTVKSVVGFGGGTSDNTIPITTARYVRIVTVTPDGPNQTGGQMAISDLNVYQ